MSHRGNNFREQFVGQTGSGQGDDSEYSSGR